jgi:hypothetical protein
MMGRGKTFPWLEQINTVYQSLDVYFYVFDSSQGVFLFIDGSHNTQ